MLFPHVHKPSCFIHGPGCLIQCTHRLVGGPGQLQGDVHALPLVDLRAVGLQADACGRRVRNDRHALAVRLEGALLLDVDLQIPYSEWEWSFWACQAFAIAQGFGASSPQAVLYCASCPVSTGQNSSLDASLKNVSISSTVETATADMSKSTLHPHQVQRRVIGGTGPEAEAAALSDHPGLPPRHLRHAVRPAKHVDQQVLHCKTHVCLLPLTRCQLEAPAESEPDELQS